MVLSVERKDKNGYIRRSRILTPHKSNRGYKHVGLSKDNKVVQFLVHTLVAMAFLENPYNLPIVNHKDENPSNNFYKNLEWCSYKYNINYGSHNEKSVKSISRKVLQYDLEGNFIREYYSVGTQLKLMVWTKNKFYVVAASAERELMEQQIMFMVIIIGNTRIKQKNL